MVRGPRSPTLGEGKQTSWRTLLLLSLSQTHTLCTHCVPIDRCLSESSGINTITKLQNKLYPSVSVVSMSDPAPFRSSATYPKWIQALDRGYKAEQSVNIKYLICNRHTISVFLVVVPSTLIYLPY